MFNTLLSLAIGALALAQPRQDSMSTLDLPPPPGMATAAPAAPAPAAPAAPAPSAPASPPVMREIGDPPASDVRVVDAEPVEAGKAPVQQRQAAPAPAPEPAPVPAPAAQPAKKAAPQSTGGRRVAAFWFILPNP
ncbi:MAG: hypothetical protein H3C30_05355 [Candidatus Hydrogenedentes bacterium]|nr:hypothetical protein [Candidatus Hydrogenedentota bacterium]